MWTEIAYEIIQNLLEFQSVHVCKLESFFALVRKYFYREDTFLVCIQSLDFGPKKLIRTKIFVSNIFIVSSLIFNLNDKFD